MNVIKLVETAASSVPNESEYPPLWPSAGQKISVFVFRLRFFVMTVSDFMCIVHFNIVDFGFNWAWESNNGESVLCVCVERSAKEDQIKWCYRVLRVRMSLIPLLNVRVWGKSFLSQKINKDDISLVSKKKIKLIHCSFSIAASCSTPWN